MNGTHSIDPSDLIPTHRTHTSFVELSGSPAADDGTLINGFFAFWQLAHPKEAYGFPRQGQTILHVPEAKTIRLYVDGEPLDVSQAEIVRFNRTLGTRQ